MNYLLIINLALFIFFYYLNSKATVIASYFELFDNPTSRKIHKKKTPLIGGLLIWFVFGINLFFQNLFFNLEINYIKFYIISSIFFLVGLFDDKFSLRAIDRLFILFFLTIIIFKLLEFQEINFLLLDDLGLVHIYYGSIFLSVFCLLLFQNAMNMIDGLNGLSGGIIVGILFFIIFKNTILSSPPLFQLLSFILLFLFFNLKNKIFLGDAGVYFLSSFLGLCIIYLSQNQGNISANSIFLIMILPGVDMLRLFVIRITNKKNPFKADKNHLHHILLMYTNSPLKTLMILLLLSFLPILLYEFFNLNFYYSIIIFFIIYIWLLSKKMNKKSLKN